jgi:uncharacterized protein YdaU (DUF1376 family)
MQLYVSDYLADTAHLNAQQHGAYMLLLMNYWQRGKPLDNTGERLAYVARMTPDEWEDNREILAEFFWVDGDIWTHARVENDLAKVREKSEQASFAGQMSGVKRKSIVRSSDVEQSLNHKEEDKEEDKDINTFDQFWEIYPIKVGKGAALRAWAKAIKRGKPAVIIEGAGRYAKDPNREPEYTAHPATWLNADRWLDSPLPPKRSQTGFRATITTPTQLPPRFTAEDAPKGVPAPANLRDLIQEMSNP